MARIANVLGFQLEELEQWRGDDSMEVTDDSKRIFVDAYHEARKRPEYIKHINNLLALGRQIAELLGPNRHLFEQYESANCLAEGICLETTYRMGVEDGLNLPKEK